MPNLNRTAPEWPGHESATSTILLALLLRAQSGGKLFSRAERILFTACEFWAAAKNRVLSGHLSAGMASKHLWDAAESFDAIGAPVLAKTLRLAHAELERSNPPSSSKVLTALSEILEDAVADSTEPVDDLIAQYACEQTFGSSNCLF